MPDFDDWIDAQLRNVPVPRHLHARIRKAGAGDRENPAAPRAQQPSADDLADDSRLDGLLRDVEIPAGLHQRLRAIPREDRWPRGYWAAAASILILLSGGAYWSLRTGSPAAPEQVAVAPASPVTRAAPAAEKAPPTAMAAASTAGAIAVEPDRQAPVTVRLDEKAKPAAPNLFTSVTGMGSSLRQALETQRRTQSALGAADQMEPLPALEMLEPPAPRGVRPPMVKGYDLLFQLRHGEHPFVLPAANASLRVSRVPFNFRTISYDQTARGVASGRLPAANEVRVEDFLAAQDYRAAAAATDRVQLDIAACPSPLGESGPRMMQVLVQGGPLTARPAPARLLAVVDTSAHMQSAARIETIRRALSKLAARMHDEDQLTLVSFAETPSIVAESLRRDDVQTLLASGKWIRVGGQANFAAAVQAARDYLAADATVDAAKQPHRVLLVTAAPAHFSRERRNEVRDHLKQLAAGGAKWHLVRLSENDADGGWGELAKDAGGHASTAATADQMALAAHEHWTGTPATVAKAVSLRIAFNPKAVTSYRLIGHEAVTLTGDAADPLKIDLAAGQTATCMFEFWLKPKGEGDIGSSELVWHDPKNGTPRRTVRPIRKEQVFATFADSPAWLQQGVVAARTAEFLRGSYYIPNSRRLGQLLDLANSADAELFKSAEYRDLLRLIEQASRLR